MKESLKGEDSLNVSSLSVDTAIVANLYGQSMSYYKKNLKTSPVFDDYLKQAEEIAVKGNMVGFLAQIYNQVGIRYRNRSEYGDALKYHAQAVDIARKMTKCDELPSYINMLAVVYRRIDENNTALDLHMEAMNIAELQKDTFQIGISLNGIGNVYLNMERYHISIEYFKKSLDISNRLNNTLGKAINTNNIGEALKFLGEVDSALVYFQQSLEFNKSINSIAGESICDNSIGEAYRIKGEYKVALEYLKKAQELAIQSRDRINVAFNYSVIGQVYFEMKDYDNALQELKKGLDVANEIGSKNQIELSTRWISMVYERLNDSSKSLFYLKEAVVYKDSLLNEENLTHLATTKAMHDLEKSNLTIELLNKQTVFQKNLIRQQNRKFLIVLILFLLVVGIAVLFVWQVKLKSKYNKVLLQQRLLRIQMNPHFIFNALSAIQVFILENDMEKSSLFLKDFASLMRQVLRSSEYEYVSLEEEVQMLKYYMELQRLRFMPTFDFEIEVSDTIDVKQILIPPMLTQPFVENAIEHGIKSLGQGGNVVVRFFTVDDFLHVEIQDNGMGLKAMPKKSMKGKKHESMAIKITNERLSIIRRVTRKRADIKIVDLTEVFPGEQGVLVQIEIPVIKSKNRNS